MLRFCEQLLDHDLINLAQGSRDDHPGADLAKLDAIRDLHHAVEHAQTRIADVVDRSLRTDPMPEATRHAVAGSKYSRQTAP